MSCTPRLYTEGHFECCVCAESGDAAWVQAHRSIIGFHQIRYVHDRDIGSEDVHSAEHAHEDDHTDDR